MVGGALADRLAPPPAAGSPGPPWPVGLVAATQVGGRPSSSWFCVGGTGPGGPAPASVVVADLGRRPLVGTLEWVSDSGRSKQVGLAVGPQGDEVVSPALAGGFLAATVELGPGPAAVSEVASGPSGQSSVPCATTTSPTWYFAGGSTVLGDSVVLCLYNPGATAALADLTFATDQGTATPGDFQGVLVPAGALVPVQVGAHVIDAHHLGITVSARQGRLVAAALVIRTAEPPPGASLVLGVPSPARTWYLPYGFWDRPPGAASPSAFETLTVYDPGPAPASVRLSLALAAGSASPLELTVPPGGRQVVDATAQARIPPGVRQAITVRSSVPVVVGRTMGAVPPAPYSGMSEMAGSPLAATRWLLGPGATGATQDVDWLSIQVPGSRPARVSVAAQGGPGGRLAPVPGLQGLVVRPGVGAWVQVPVPTERAHPCLLVSSDRPVAVERDLYVSGAPGLSSSTGMP